MTIFQTSDSIWFSICSLTLFVNHSLRDYLITGINSIAFQPEQNATINYQDNEQSLAYAMKEGWTLPLVGGVLSSIHWGWLVSLITISFYLKRTKVKNLLVCSLLLSGIFSLLNEVSTNRGSTTLIISRFLQGIFQGWCYPAIISILGGLNIASNIFPYFVIFIAPWVGSSTGVLLGWSKYPFVTVYVFGTFSIILGAVATQISFNDKSQETQPKRAWRECLRSSAVWSCLFLQMGADLVLYWFLIGLSFTLQFQMDRRELIWNIAVVILVGGVFTRIAAMAGWSLLRNHFVTPLSRRRFLIFAGSTVSTVSLIIVGVCGINREFLAFGMSLFGVCGIGLTMVGIRLNLHDLGPLFPIPFLILGSIGSSFGAGLASILYPVLLQVGGDAYGSIFIYDENTHWQITWMAPICVIVVTFVAHFLCTSVDPLPHQTSVVSNMKIPEILINGSIPKREEIDEKSFKSVKSALSFKTAQGNTEYDLQSIPGTDRGECLSQVDDNFDDLEEIKSIRSGVTSFKSINECHLNNSHGDEYGIILNAHELDRTTAWLSTHHSPGLKNELKNSLERTKIEQNVLLALHW